MVKGYPFTQTGEGSNKTEIPDTHKNAEVLAILQSGIKHYLSSFELGQGIKFIELQTAIENINIGFSFILEKLGDFG